MIDIVIVNWNSGKYLEKALQSIKLSHDNQVNKVIVIDNASSDHSLSFLNSLGTAPFEIDVIRNSNNCGFAAACNQGAKRGNSEYILFLNPDTTLFETSLRIPLEFMNSAENAHIGICGIQLIDEEGKVSRTCERFPSTTIFLAEAIGLNKIPPFHTLGKRMKEWDHTTQRKVDQVMGAFFLIRRSLFKMLNGFDERFFVYLEEVDISYRAKQMGWECVYLAEAQAFHAGGGTSRQVKAARLFYLLRSRLLYGFKHFNSAQAWLLFFVTICIEPITRTLFSLLNTKWPEVRDIWKAYGMLFEEFKKLCVTRR